MRPVGIALIALIGALLMNPPPGLPISGRCGAAIRSSRLPQAQPPPPGDTLQRQSRSIRNGGSRSPTPPWWIASSLPTAWLATSRWPAPTGPNPRASDSTSSPKRPSTLRDQLLLMLRTLLTEGFHPCDAHERRAFAHYVLVFGKNGPSCMRCNRTPQPRRPNVVPHRRP